MMLRCHLKHALEVVICFFPKHSGNISKRNNAWMVYEMRINEIGDTTTKDAFGGVKITSLYKINKEREGRRKS